MVVSLCCSPSLSVTLPYLSLSLSFSLPLFLFLSLSFSLSLFPSHSLSLSTALQVERDCLFPLCKPNQCSLEHRSTATPSKEIWAHGKLEFR